MLKLLTLLLKSLLQSSTTNLKGFGKSELSFDVKFESFSSGFFLCRERLFLRVKLARLFFLMINFAGSYVLDRTDCWLHNMRRRSTGLMG
jgi:hypothetical protein